MKTLQEKVKFFTSFLCQNNEVLGENWGYFHICSATDMGLLIGRYRLPIPISIFHICKTDISADNRYIGRYRYISVNRSTAAQHFKILLMICNVTGYSSFYSERTYNKVVDTRNTFTDGRSSTLYYVFQL